MDGRVEVTLDDVREAAPLVLAHRRREAGPPPPPPEHDHSHQDPAETEVDEPQENAGDGPMESEDQPGAEQALEAGPPEEAGKDDGPPSVKPDRPGEVEDRVFEVGQTFAVKSSTRPRTACSGGDRAAAPAPEWRRSRAGT